MAALTTARRSIRTRRNRRLNAARRMVLSALAVLYMLPLYSMAEFTTRGVKGSGRNLSEWRAIVTYPYLIKGVTTSLELAVITSLAMLVLLLPTMILVRLRLARLSRVVEFISLLPLTIPAIVLVVGLAPVYAWVSYLLGNSSLTLSFVYVVLTLPYAYRALDAGLSMLDLRTLSEAARSLGARWTAVMFQIVLPNLRGAVLNASLLSVALVLGEFTLASLLNFNTLQTSIYLAGQTDPGISIAVSLAALLFVFALLVLLSFVDRRVTRRSTEGVRV